MEEDFSKIYEYEFAGKQYANEIGVISMTSWKKRINTCSKTVFSLLKQCPNFHIVLVLSKDEFPLKEKELPNDLMLFVNNKLIELFWINKNLKSFKKILFTMDKYRNVPVISADDDCIYTCNYAQELYDKWKEHSSKQCLIRWTHRIIEPIGTQGPCTLYSPESTSHIFDTIQHFNLLTNDIIHDSMDDDFMAILIKKLHLKLFDLNKPAFPFKFHTSIEPLHKNQKNNGWEPCFELLDLK